MKTEFEIFQGDITTLVVDAIVNAANSALSGGGGVDGAIHRAAGPELLEECRQLGRCPTGEARITKGYRLPAKFVIHAVGPVWREDNREAALLASCYRYSLNLAVENEVKTIAFPAISTGIYGYPPKPAARIAVTETVDFLQQNNSLEKVIFVCFDQKTHQIYFDTFQNLGIELS